MTGHAQTMPRPQVGASATVTHRVTESDSAARWGNELPVLATPVLLWLAEIACMRAVDDVVGDGWMTVGVHHDAAHEAPTVVGDTVRVTARLVEVRDKHLTFEVQGEDSAERRVLSGRHSRGIVEAARFRARIEAAAGREENPERSTR